MARIVFPMLMMLIAGLAVGSSGSTLLWSGKMDRQFQAQAQWKAIADKQSDVIAEQGKTIKEQGDALRNLTAATETLIEATKK